MNTVSELKKLATKITGINEVPGNTIAEVISFINANYRESNGLVLKDANGVVYDVRVTTTGTLIATARR